MKSPITAAACAMGAGATLALLGEAARRSRRKRLAGQVVLITGGSRGFGLALAQEFAALPCRIAILARDPEELERARQLLIQKGCDAFTIACDVSDREAVSRSVEAVARHYGQIDILVNNAGEITVSPFENLQIADFERAMAIMFWGVLYSTLAVLPEMERRGSGRIVNVTSIGGKVSVPHLLGYSCAKAAATALSEALRNELRQFGITVTTVIPGLMRTGSHVNARFKGEQSSEAAWFGSAASLPFLSLSAERAARLAVDAVCAGKAEATLGVPAQILSKTQALFPGLASELLRLSNSWLPKSDGDSSLRAGRELEDDHGSLYRLLTMLGREAGKRLNQPV